MSKTGSFDERVKKRIFLLEEITMNEVKGEVGKRRE